MRCRNTSGPMLFYGPPPCDVAAAVQKTRAPERRVPDKSLHVVRLRNEWCFLSQIVGLRLARCLHDVHDVILHAVIDVNAVDYLLAPAMIRFGSTTGSTRKSGAEVAIRSRDISFLTFLRDIQYLA